MIYLHLIFAFLKVGFLGFGGGLAMLPLIYQTVQEFGFMDSEEFSNLVALSQITPGPIAANTATYIGFKVAGIWGGMAATFGVTVPSFVMVISSMKVMDKLRNSEVFKNIRYGVRPATAGLIAAAAVFVGSTSLLEVFPLMVCLVSLILVGKFKMSTIKVILIMIMVGIAGSLIGV